MAGLARLRVVVAPAQDCVALSAQASMDDGTQVHAAQCRWRNCWPSSQVLSRCASLGVMQGTENTGWAWVAESGA